MNKLKATILIIVGYVCFFCSLFLNILLAPYTVIHYNNDNSNAHLVLSTYNIITILILFIILLIARKYLDITSKVIFIAFCVFLFVRFTLQYIE